MCVLHCVIVLVWSGFLLSGSSTLVCCLTGSAMTTTATTTATATTSAAPAPAVSLSAVVSHVVSTRSVSVPELEVLQEFTDHLDNIPDLMEAGFRLQDMLLVLVSVVGPPHRGKNIHICVCVCVCVVVLVAHNPILIWSDCGPIRHSCSCCVCMCPDTL